jgi:hypothetical protein
MAPSPVKLGYKLQLSISVFSIWCALHLVEDGELIFNLIYGPWDPLDWTWRIGWTIVGTTLTFVICCISLHLATHSQRAIYARSCKDKDHKSIDDNVKKNGVGVKVTMEDRETQTEEEEDVFLDASEYISKEPEHVSHICGKEPEEMFDWNDVYEEEAARRKIERKKQEEEARKASELRNIRIESAFAKFTDVQQKFMLKTIETDFDDGYANLLTSIMEPLKDYASRAEHSEVDKPLNGFSRATIDDENRGNTSRGSRWVEMDTPNEHSRAQLSHSAIHTVLLPETG